MSIAGYARLIAGFALLALAGACTTVNRVDMTPPELRDELRMGGVVKTGDQVTVVSEVQGDLTFQVTDVDGDSIKGDSVEVPIDEILLLEKRVFAPLRTGGAVYGGTYAVLITVVSLSWIVGILF